MSEANVDDRVRARAFEFLRQQTELHGEILSHAVLSQGFEFDGRRVPLLGPQGIFKPAVLPEMPLSIMTKTVVEGEARPYEDGMGPDGLLRYRYRGTDAAHRDNVGLRLAMRRGVPLVYLFGVTRGRYMPVWPVFIVRDQVLWLPGLIVGISTIVGVQLSVKFAVTAHQNTLKWIFLGMGMLVCVAALLK